MCLICGGGRGCTEHKFLPHADSRVIPILHSPWATIGVSHFLNEEAILLAPFFSSFSILRGGVTIPSVMEASWFCEKSSGIGKVEDVKPVL